MNTFEQLDQSSLRNVLRARLPQLDAVIVFGTVLYFAEILFSAWLAAKRVLRKTVNLVDLCRTTTILQMQALQDGHYISGTGNLLTGVFDFPQLQEFANQAAQPDGRHRRAQDCLRVN